VSDPLHPNGQAPFSVEAFSCQKAGNARTEYEDAGPFAARTRPTVAASAVADGATESSFSALWAALLVESFVRGRSHGPDFFRRPGRHPTPVVAKDPQPFAALVRRREGPSGAYAAFVGASLNAVNRGWRAVAIGDCCLFHVSGLPPDMQLLHAFPLTRSEEFGSSPYLVGSVKRSGDDPLRRARERGSPRGQRHPLFASDALAAWLLRRAEKGEPAWETISLRIQTQEDFELLVAQAREDGTRNDDMTLVRLSRRPGRAGAGTSTMATWPDLTDYHEALQSPQRSLSDPELQRAQIDKDRFGMPKPATGGNAVVYKRRKARTSGRCAAFSGRFSTTPSATPPFPSTCRRIVPRTAPSSSTWPMVSASRRHVSDREDGVGPGPASGSLRGKPSRPPKELAGLREKFRTLVKEVEAAKFAHVTFSTGTSW